MRRTDRLFAILACVLTGLVWFVSVRYYGPQNLLWFSNISVLLMTLTLVTRHPLPASSAAVGVLVLETVWSLDFFLRLATGGPVLGLTEYVFIADHLPHLGERPAWVRAVAVYHVLLVPGLIWAVRRYGYDGRALLVWPAIALVIGAVCLVFTGETTDVNRLRGFAVFDPSWMTAGGYVGVWFHVQLLFFWIPTHLLLRWRLGAAAPSRLG
jgi:hypothetical protein